MDLAALLFPPARSQTQLLMIWCLAWAGLAHVGHTAVVPAKIWPENRPVRLQETHIGYLSSASSSSRFTISVGVASKVVMGLCWI